MRADDREKWDARYLSGWQADKPPAEVLNQNLNLLPSGGKALDLACGTGTNALALARAGLDVHAWDISGVALDILQQRAMSAGLHITTQQRDVTTHPPEMNSFDVIVISRFLERRLAAPLVMALKSGGRLFYQTWTLNKPPQIGPSNPDYLLTPNELLNLFRGLTVLFYREGFIPADPCYGEALLVAQR